MLELCLWFLGGSLLVYCLALGLRGISWRPALLNTAITFSVLCVLTAVFDNLMIAVGLFDYGHSNLLGWYIGLAPIEDFFYPAVAALLVPGIYWLCGGAVPETEGQRP